MSRVDQATGDQPSPDLNHTDDEAVDDDGSIGTDGSALQEDPLELNEIFDILKNERRRSVIEHLRTTDGPVELGHVAERIAAAENDKSVSAITYDERKRVYVALYQCHLPRMDEVGIVSFNQSRGLVELTDQATELEQFLDITPESTLWYRYYLSIAAVGLVLLAGSVVSGLLSATLVLGLVLVALFVCAGLHAWQMNGR
jgi:hypothetical protein